MSKKADAIRKPADGSWLPVIMSLAVYPGIGQWMQQRRNAGTFYFFVFTVIAVMFCFVLFVYCREVVPILLNAIEGRYEEGQELPSAMRIVKPLGAVLFVYLANAVDVLRGRAQVIQKLKRSDISGNC